MHYVGPYIANAVLDYLGRGKSLAVIGTTFWVGLFTTNPVYATTAPGLTSFGVEASGGGYARKSAVLYKDGQGELRLYSVAQFDAPTTNWGSVTGWGIWRTESGGIQDLMFWGTFANTPIDSSMDVGSVPLGAVPRDFQAMNDYTTKYTARSYRLLLTPNLDFWNDLEQELVWRLTLGVGNINPSTTLRVTIGNAQYPNMYTDPNLVTINASRMYGTGGETSGPSAGVTNHISNMDPIYLPNGSVCTDPASTLGAATRIQLHNAATGLIGMQYLKNSVLVGNDQSSDEVLIIAPGGLKIGMGSGKT